MIRREPNTAFGLVDFTMVPKLNRILRPHKLKLSVRSCAKEWGDQVEIKVIDLRKKRRTRRTRRDDQPMNAGIGTYGIQMGN